MMYTKKLFSFLLLFAFQLACYAETPTDTLNQRLKNIKSMQANFTQSVVDNHGKIIQKSRGKMALQRPGQFRWETISPNKQLIVANGTRLWIYDPDLEQVVIRALAKQAGETPALLLSDTHLSLDKDFIVKQVKGTESVSSWFLLLPKDKSSVMASIRMGFKGDSISEMQLQDHLGHTTAIQFQNIKSNSPLSASLFNFTPPKHVDVIDETKQ
jgi:outer membrane lipoprotein carrier protein